MPFRMRRLFPKDITGTITAGQQPVEVHWHAGTLLLDEPTFNGGQDLGPDPFSTVLAGLIGCTLTTLRMYVRRKGWDITDIQAAVNIAQQQEPFKTVIYRTITIGQPISDAQREKLLYIAKNCPVARLLQGEVAIETVL